MFRIALQFLLPYVLHNTKKIDKCVCFSFSRDLYFGWAICLFFSVLYSDISMLTRNLSISIDSEPSESESEEEVPAPVVPKV